MKKERRQGAARGTATAHDDLVVASALALSELKIDFKEIEIADILKEIERQKRRCYDVDVIRIDLYTAYRRRS